MHQLNIGRVTPTELAELKALAETQGDGDVQHMLRRLIAQQLCHSGNKPWPWLKRYGYWYRVCAIHTSGGEKPADAIWTTYEQAAKHMATIAVGLGAGWSLIITQSGDGVTWEKTR